MKISALIRQYCIRVCYRPLNFNGALAIRRRKRKEDRFCLPPLTREFANKGPYKTFRRNEIGDCVCHAEWINRNRLSDTSRMRGRYVRSDDDWIRPVLLNAISPRLIVLAKLLCYELRWTMTSDSNGEIWISMVRIVDHLSSKFDLRARLNKSGDIISRFFSGIKW